MDKKDIIRRMIGEAQAYSTLDSIEKIVQEGDNLSFLPVQPLYIVLKSMIPQDVGAALAKFSRDQRTAFLDLDLWQKDDIDTDGFEFWIQTYSTVKDELLLSEFVKGEEFAMYLKSRFNIQTFDVEDPNYPDHDNYFLTDDSLLLIEFDAEYNQVDEVRSFIRLIYSELGVENAYSYLFKLVVDSFLIMQEEEYRQKKSRLAEFGMVDYFDALEIDNTFPNVLVMDNFISKKDEFTAHIDDIGKNQALHSTALIAYESELMDGISEELSNVSSQKRFEYLHFNFMRLVNGTISLSNSLKEGSIAMTRIGNKTRNLLLLGFNYTKYYNNKMKGSAFTTRKCLFDNFDFIDFYKIGNTLVGDMKKKLKKALKSTPFENNEGFLGGYWANYLDDSFSDIVKVHRFSKGITPIHEVKDYLLWDQKGKTLISLIPFIENFYESFRKLESEQKIQDSFYVNYNVSDIDFEAIILSSLANFMLGNYSKETSSKMGISVKEYKTFAKMIVDRHGKIFVTTILLKTLRDFGEKYGFDHCHKFNYYLQELISEHIEGYKYDSITEDDFKHVGGPIIF